MMITPHTPTAVLRRMVWNTYLEQAAVALATAGLLWLTLTVAAYSERVSIRLVVCVGITAMTSAQGYMVFCSAEKFRAGLRKLIKLREPA